MHIEVGIFMLGVLITLCVQGATLGMYILFKEKWNTANNNTK